MKFCPKCNRFSIEFDPHQQVERCLWKDCLWINTNNENLDELHKKNGLKLRWKDKKEEGILIEA